jgi:tetratricopeptide (TPR) repeat protein
MPRPHPATNRDLQAGLAFHQAGRLAEAEMLYRKVLKRDAGQPDALNLLGVIAQAQGHPARAVQLIARALHRNPDFPEALTNLARAQRAAGDAEGAADSARQALALAPDLADAHLQLGRALLDLRDHEAAADACRRAVALAPQSLDAQVNLGAALTRLKDYLGAAQVYQVAHTLKPDRAETLTDFAATLTELERYDDALRCHARAVALAPDDPRAHAGHAATLKQAQEVTRSIEACHRALDIDPEQAAMWLLLGANLASLGKFGEAVGCYRRVLELDPHSTEAQRAMVAVGEQLEDVAELEGLAAVLEDETLAPLRRIAAGYALGALLDRNRDYDAAFARYATANRLARAERLAEGKAFDRAALQLQVDTQIAAFPPAVFGATRDWGDPSERPVFIVGMPRSGTTLAEQIAASHPQVFGAGERRDIGRIARLLAGERDGGSPLGWDRALLRHEATEHVARLGALGDGAARVIDKMPDNVLWLGVIAVLFPNARIVLCRRDLRDVCLSCHFQSFTAGMPWTNDLADCAFRALEIERLIDHWRAVLPLPVLELQYETLIAEPERESRRLVEFLGLPWDPACLAFHKTERPVITASLWQVRQPLYSTGVGRWRNYRRHLGPLLAGLSPVIPIEADD